MRIIIPIIIIVSVAGYFAQEQLKNPNEVLVQQGNALEKYDAIQVSNPKSSSLVVSPILVEGIARGYWFPEGDFLIKIQNAKDEELGAGIAYAMKGGTEEEFIPFEAMVSFSESFVKEGVIILKKSNPSGLLELDDELRVPVRF